MIEDIFKKTSQSISLLRSQLKSGFLSIENGKYYILALVMLLGIILSKKYLPNINNSYLFIAMLVAYIGPFLLGSIFKIILLKDLGIIIEANNFLINELSEISKTQQILYKTHLIYKMIKKIFFYKKIGFGTFIIYLYKGKYNFLSQYFSGKRGLNGNLEKLYRNESILIYNFLVDLRSDLAIRLTEQQQSLESTKSEVESNIKGSTELEQVSELQKMRLDKQIEQFEELQRVLVKA